MLKEFNIQSFLKLGIGLSFLAAAFLFVIGFYYTDLGCDGGWYSYPALALSRGGSPDENLKTVDEIKHVGGVKALFGFKTYTSIRTLYTSLWFRYISKDIYFLKLLSGLELVTMLTFGYLLISRFCVDKLSKMAIFSILINDKSFIINAASDFRPDNLVAALTCLTFLTLLKSPLTLFRMLSAMVVSSMLLLVHVTAIIPFLCISVFFLFESGLNYRWKVSQNYKYILIVIWGICIFLISTRLFDALLLPRGELIPSSVKVGERVLQSWNEGLRFLFNKELLRWWHYFFTSNVATLFSLLVGIGLIFYRWYGGSLLKSGKRGLALLLALATGTSLLLAFDPHLASAHAIPIVVFFFFFLVHEVNVTKLSTKALTLLLVGLVYFASLSSVALATKIFVESRRSGFTVSAIKDSLEALTMSNKKAYLIIGPTEVWPFIKAEKNVLIIDKGARIIDPKITGPIIGSVDYVILNNDFGPNWERDFSKIFTQYNLVRIRQLGDAKRFLKIYRLVHGTP